MTNPYFAYSIRQGFEPAPITLPPIHSQAAKKLFRACDACSVRKTKCDESRPCRHCVNNGLQCTDLRQRKKSGPKSLRKKTIASIHGVGPAPPPARPAAPPAPRELSDIALELSALSPELFEACVPFTLPSLAQGFAVALAAVSRNSEGSVAPMARFAVVTLALVAHEVAKLGNSTPISSSVSEQIKTLVGLSMRACGEALLFESPKAVGFDERYHLAVAELHLFSYLYLQGHANAQKTIHLRTAIAHFQQLEQEKSARYRELHRTLYVWERHCVLFAEERQFRASEPVISPIDGPDFTSHALLDSYYELLVGLEKSQVFREQIPEPFCWMRESYCKTSPLQYSQVKAQLVDEAQAQESDVMKTLVLGARFKVLLVCSTDMDQTYLSHELFDIITTMNHTLARASSRLKLYMESLSLSSCLSEILGAFSQVTPLDSVDPVIKNALLESASYILPHKRH